jgi:hypothetical protein
MIISILGMSGMDREKLNKTTAYYNCKILNFDHLKELFELLRFYYSNAFDKKEIHYQRTKEKNSSYNINQDIITFITQKDIPYYRENYYDRNFGRLYQINIKLFYIITKEYTSLRKLRNTLTHIGAEVHNRDIKTRLQEQLKNITDIINKNILQNISTTPERRVIKNFHKQH